MTLLKKYKANGQKQNHPEDAISVEQLKKQTRARRIRAARVLAAQIQETPDGRRTFIRFSREQCREHQLLIITFTTLAVTGLLQRYSHLFLVGVIVGVFGGMDTLQAFHHLAAVVFIIQSLYHLGVILIQWFVKRERGSMWPRFKDLRDLFQMVKFNLGLAEERPEFDRFSVEEKLEYWALLWGTPLMIITGLVMWFPIPVTAVLPGDAIPISRAVHAWEAILATLAILIWHTYHTVIKERNRSIFSGTVTEQEMQHGHPREYRRILAAHEYLRKIAAPKMTKENDLAGSEHIQEEGRYEVV